MRPADSRQEKLLHIVQAGLFAALTALLTASLHIPVTNGYIHCGDAVIYLAAALLPAPYAVCAGGIGGAVADLLSGYPVYALPTLLIKAAGAWCFARIGGKRLFCRRRLAALTLCGLISVLGYWLTAVLLYGGWGAQLAATVPANCIQAAASAGVYLLLAAALEKALQRGE